MSRTNPEFPEFEFPLRLSSPVGFLGQLFFVLLALVLMPMKVNGFTLPVPTLQDEIDFNRDVKPILSDSCFFCHGQDEKNRMADLRLDDRSSAMEAGAIEPKFPDQSELVNRILSEDPELKMPPPKSHRVLTPLQIDILKRWIKQGAKYDQHWTFVPPSRPTLPQLDESAWTRNPIDAFVLQKMNEIGLSPSPSADKTTLIKRVYADLIGLPPSIEEIEAFVNSQDPNAYSQIVDKLLESPHYGERMAVPWLDAARYADSNGFQQDGDTWQWIWRDWIVSKLNENLPFDQFSIWQLAGDLLEKPSQEQLIATAFNRNHLLNGEGGGIAEEQRFVILFDRMDTTATNWLGMTFACAQCHSHKYDPISQTEYYQVLDMFNHVPESGRPEEIAPIRFRLDTPFIEFATEEQKQHVARLQKEADEAKVNGPTAIKLAFASWKMGLHASPTAAHSFLSKESQACLDKSETERSDEEKKKLEEELQKHFDENVRPKLAGEHHWLEKEAEIRKRLFTYQKTDIPRLMVMSDAKPRPTHVLNRGQYLEPLEKVAFDVPKFLPQLPADFPRNRLGFAKWLFLPENPLVARVQVNRIWQHFFGTGIVATSEDFGVQSEYPIHKDLLDWLAVEFRDNGWNMKKLHRLIVASATYQQSSHLSPKQREIDPNNRYFARASRLRMPSMILRDWALATSGLLEKNIGGAPVYPYQPTNVWEPLAITKERDFSYPQSTGKDLYRRSLYTFWRRTISPANMFDASNRQACRVRSSNSNTPLHALTTLNDPTWVEAARVLAGGVMTKQTERTAQLKEVFYRILCRPPTADEMTRLKKMWKRQFEFYEDSPEQIKLLMAVGQTKSDDKLDQASMAALTNVCIAIFNLDEAITRQ